MKPFDLERAKAGDPMYTRGSDYKRMFIGLDRSGYIVTEDLMGQLIRYSAEQVYMAPKKRTVWIVINGTGSAKIFNSKESANLAYPELSAYAVEIDV